MKRKKGSKERRERKGRGEEGSGGWREGRKEEKREEEREELQKRVRNCGQSEFYLETAALYIISVGFPCKP